MRPKAGIKLDAVDFVAVPDLLDEIVATAAAVAADLQRLGFIAPS